MATKSTESDIAINADAIEAAIKQAVENQCSGESDKAKELIVKVAIECIADEMDHGENPGKIQINKSVTARLDQLVIDSEAVGFKP